MMVKAICFDAYGTLFDVYSVGALTEKLFPGHGKSVSESWRDKQIEYTRLRTMCDQYKDFWEVTKDALVFSCRKLQLDLTEEKKNELMDQYAKLPAFSENLEVLKALKKKGIKLAILSNGTPSMLESAVKAAGMEDIFNHLLSAHTVQKFKCHPEVSDILLVSS
jgi:2-haloacid dehalogenase